MKKRQTGLITVLGILGVLTIFPFYLTIVNSLKHNLQIIESIWFFDLPMHFDNYLTAFREIWRGMLNSVFYTTVILVVTMVISSLAGYAFARFSFPGKTICYFGVIMFLMIPGFVAPDSAVYAGKAHGDSGHKGRTDPAGDRDLCSDAGDVFPDTV